MGEQIISGVKKSVEKHLEDAWHLSAQLREQPELPYEEYESSKKMVQVLKNAGFDVTYPFAGYDTAYSAVLDCGEGPSVAVLAEYDALPDIGHGCGHNLHGALSVLTGLALSDMKDSFRGKLYVIGTPAEEEDGAKIGMARQGIFDDMSLAMMMHSWGGGISLPDMDVLSLRCYVVEFHGESAHAVAAPWCGKSALAAGRKFLDLIDARRECFTPDIRVNAVILDGGKAPNIIPDYTKLRMEFRTGSMARLEEADAMIRKCAQAAAMALDCTVTLSSGLSDFADMVLNPVLEHEVRLLLEEAGHTVGSVAPATGSSDMGNVSYRCPSIQPLLSITDDALALHTAAFRDATGKAQAKEALKQGACVLAALALKTFNDESFRESVHTAFLAALEAKKKQ